MKKYRKICVFIFIQLLIAGSSTVMAAPVPLKWQQQLDKKREANDLEYWIYTWIEALTDTPENIQAWAEIILKERWRRPETEDEHSAWLLLLVNQGFYLLQHGNIIQSIASYENAYHYYTQHSFMDAEEVVEHIIFPLGNNYTRLGDYPRALFIQEKGLTLIQNANQPQLLAVLYNNLAISSRWAENSEQAAVYASSGLIVPGISPVVKAQLLTTLADIELFQGVAEGPEGYIREAHTILKKQSLTEDIALRLSGTEVVLAAVHSSANRYPQALAALNHALRLLNTYFVYSKPREKAKIQIEIGNVYLQMGRYSSALQGFSQASALLLPEDKPDFVYAESALLDAAQGMAKAHTGLHMPQQALKDYLTAFAVSEKLRQIFYSQSSKKKQQQVMRTMAEEAIELAFSLYKTSHESQYALIALSIAEQHKARVLADELNRHITMAKLDETNPLVQEERRLSRASSFYEGELMQARVNKRSDTASLVKKLADVNYQLSLLQPRLDKHFPALRTREPLTTAVTRTQLDKLPGSLQVQSYFCGLRNWYAFSFSQKGIHRFERLGQADKLNTQTDHFNNTYFQHGPSALYNHPQEYFKEAAALYNLLFTSSLVQQPLLIMADGALNMLPFDALLTHNHYSNTVQDWPFLTKTHRLSFTYSLANWYEQANGKVLRKKTGRFTGFFIPFTGAHGQDELPAVRTEMDLLKRLVAGRFFWGEDAESKTLLELLPKSDVVHISTHAMLLGPDKMPALLFHDQQVLLPDLYQSMVHPSLVVLGACQTGSGQLDAGEGLISLAREFIAGGTGGVVSGLWNINDEAAARFMEKFYQHLLDGETKAAALHLTKTDWLADPGIPPLQKLPYYWAGLVYNGDFETVQLSEAWIWSNQRVLALSLLIAGLITGTAFLWWRKKPAA